MLSRFKSGDIDAFETLFRQYQHEVYGWIVRIVRNTAVAEDLTLETFWRIYQHRSRFDPDRPFGPWARRIATRLALDHLKSNDRLATELIEEPAATAADPVERRELRRQIRQAFDSLPARLKIAAILALIEERPYAEIADALDLSLSAVKMRVSRAVEALRKKLTNMGIQP